MLSSALPDWHHPAARGPSQERVCICGRGHDFEGGCLQHCGASHTGSSGSQAVFNEGQRQKWNRDDTF